MHPIFWVQDINQIKLLLLEAFQEWKRQAKTTEEWNRRKRKATRKKVTWLVEEELAATLDFSWKERKEEEKEMGNKEISEQRPNITAISDATCASSVRTRGLRRLRWRWDQCNVRWPLVYACQDCSVQCGIVELGASFSTRIVECFKPGLQRWGLAVVVRSRNFFCGICFLFFWGLCRGLFLISGCGSSHAFALWIFRWRSSKMTTLCVLRSAIAVVAIPVGLRICRSLEWCNSAIETASFWNNEIYWCFS